MKNIEFHTNYQIKSLHETDRRYSRGSVLSFWLALLFEKPPSAINTLNSAQGGPTHLVVALRAEIAESYLRLKNLHLQSIL